MMTKKLLKNNVFLNTCLAGPPLDFLSAVILKTLETETVQGKTVSLTITGDDDIRDLNKRFRGKDFPTDVLSFPLGDDELLGDIVISLPAARRNAADYNQGDVQRELILLTIHGTLHLLGYDHHTDDEAAIMERKEKSILEFFE